MSAPTATLTAVPAITAASTAAKTLTVTYQIANDCDELTITVPWVESDCDCIFVQCNLLYGTYTFTILEDAYGQRYCVPSEWKLVGNVDRWRIGISGVAPTLWAQNNYIAGVEGIAETPFFVYPSLQGVDLCQWNNCNFENLLATGAVSGTLFENQTGEWSIYVRATVRKQSEADEYLVEVVMYSSGHNAFGVWRSSGVPAGGGFTLPSMGNILGSLFLTEDSTAYIGPAGYHVRLQPDFDADGNLFGVTVQRKDEDGSIDDIGYYAAAEPADCATLAGGVELSGAAGFGYCQSPTIYASVEAAIDRSTIATSNLRVTGPFSYDELATLVSASESTDTTPITAVYSVPAPTGGWTWAANGDYTIAMVADEVSSTAGNSVAAGTLGTFGVTILGAPVVCYEVLDASGLPVTGDADNHTIHVAYDGLTGEPWQGPTEVSASTLPGLYRVTLTESQAEAALVSVGGTTTTSGARVRPALNVPGPLHGGDVTSIDGSTAAVGYLKKELLYGIAHGYVVAYTGDGYDDGYGYGYGYGYEDCTPSVLTFCTDLPVRADDDYADQACLFMSGALLGVSFHIKASTTDGGRTVLTVYTAKPLSAAPAAGDEVWVLGCLQPREGE